MTAIHHLNCATMRPRGSPPARAPGLAAFQRLMAVDDSARRHNRDRLRELAATHSPDLDVFCAHDPVALARLC